MQPLRRWAPPVRDATRASSQLADDALEHALPQDLAFCSKLLLHGGVAVAEEGFTAEAELLRMRQAGLLELQRDQAPPFAVTRVSLSQKARELLSNGGRTATGRNAKKANVAKETKPAPAFNSKQEQMLRRNGFEVARGMLNAAVKSEIAAWMAAGGPGGYSALETRILTRISDIEVPFPG